jgi:hypothetical protein
VAAATLVARRLGHRAGGLVSGIPVVAAPIVLIYAIEQGEGFARAAAAAAVLGLISQVGFCVTYVLVATRASWPLALVAASFAFALGTLLLSAVEPPLLVNVVAALAAIAGGAMLIDRYVSPSAGAEQPEGDLLLWRLAITAALVVALTAAAGGLSAHLAGLLTPFPIITAVMACFTHARVGAAAAIELLGGLVMALTCFLAFFAVLAALLGHVGGPAAFGLSAVASLAWWLALAWRVGGLTRSSTGAVAAGC